MTKKTNKKDKEFIKEMGQYIDHSMKSAKTFKQSVAVLNRAMNHIDEYEKANA